MSEERKNGLKEMLEIENKRESAKELANTYRMLLGKKIIEITSIGDTALVAKLEEELTIANDYYCNASKVEIQEKILTEYPLKCRMLIKEDVKRE